MRRDERHKLDFAVGALDLEVHCLARLDRVSQATERVSLGPVELQAGGVDTLGEAERQDAHADEIAPVDALEALGDDRLHAEQARPPSRPSRASCRCHTPDPR